MVACGKSKSLKTKNAAPGEAASQEGIRGKGQKERENEKDLLLQKLTFIIIF
jgi:hypothetical protein